MKKKTAIAKFSKEIALGSNAQLLQFADLNGKSCSLQQSSASMPDPGAIWLGVGEERMHLSAEHVQGLVLFLKSWLKHGVFFDKKWEPKK